MGIGRSRFLVWLVVPVGFTAYLITLSPTVGLIDSGELAAGCNLLNVLHPTGYPLYTMLGRLASLVPVATVVNRVAALSAALAACGVGLFLLLGLRLGLSPILVREIFDIIRDINRQGTAILLVEQNAFMALQVAHRAYVLETGKVVLSGPAAELLRDPKVKAAYLGE